MNGLHSTPDSGPCSRDLVGKILPLVDRENADIDTLIFPVSTRARPLAMEEEEDGEDDEEDVGDDEDDLMCVCGLV